MATFTLFDANGNEREVEITNGMTLGDFVGTGQQGLVDGQVMDNSTALREGDEVEIIAKSGKAGARIKSLQDVVNKGCVEVGDYVDFAVKGEVLKYIVREDHLNEYHHEDNGVVLDRLGLNKKAFARLFYTEDDSRKGFFPEYDSLESATRIIAALYLVIDAQTPRTHSVVIDGKEVELSHDSYKALQQVFSKK